MTDETDTSYPERIAIALCRPYHEPDDYFVLDATAPREAKMQYARADLYEAERKRAEKAEAALRLCADALDVVHSEVRHSDAVQAALRQDEGEE